MTWMGSSASPLPILFIPSTARPFLSWPNALPGEKNRSSFLIRRPTNSAPCPWPGPAWPSLITSITKKEIDISPSAGADAPVVDQKEKGQEEQPDLLTLRVEYTALSHQLAQLDANKQAGQWARLYRQVQAAEARLRQAEQGTQPSPIDPLECAKQAEEHSCDEETCLPATKNTEAGERQERLRAIASELLYWKGGLKVLRQAQLPKWRGRFQWQIEAKIESLQAEFARVRAETG